MLSRWLWCSSLSRSTWAWRKVGLGAAQVQSYALYVRVATEAGADVTARTALRRLATHLQCCKKSIRHTARGGFGSTGRSTASIGRTKGALTWMADPGDREAPVCLDCEENDESLRANFDQAAFDG